MAIVSGQLKEAGIQGKPRDIMDEIFSVAPTDTPFLSMCGRTEASQALHEWQTDDLVLPGENERLEGADTTEFTSTASTELNNRTQILSKAINVSGTAQAVLEDLVEEEIAEIENEEAEDSPADESLDAVAEDLEDAVEEAVEEVLEEVIADAAEDAASFVEETAEDAVEETVEETEELVTPAVAVVTPAPAEDIPMENRPRIRIKPDPTVALVDISSVQYDFEDGDTVNLATLRELGLIHPTATKLKVYTTGDVSKPLNVEANHLTLDAIKAISDADGSIAIMQ